MEILYSKTILAFLKKVKGLAQEILTEEMSLPVGRSRFHIGALSYPLHFTVFDHPSKLGYFQHDLYEIGINKLFLLEEEETIKDLLRHELAHYMTFIEHGPDVSPHGKEFREICKKYGWSTEVARAQVSIEKAVKNKQIVDKVRKLLSLATSPEPKEAEAATLKAQELLAKYNVKFHEEDDPIHLLRVLQKKRGSAKLQAIASILRLFFVYPIFNHGKGVLYLEILGDPLNIEVAEYVAHFLDHHFELLWKEAKKEEPRLKGTVAKNSFFRGIAEGYEKKGLPTSRTLIQIEKSLAAIYPQITSRKVSYHHSEAAAKKGREKGKGLKIREGLRQKKQQLAINIKNC
ncbi:SprT-like domain-containing protein [Candidatus Neptunochlamydia vexilliferae]|nr:SprT-like domain-containing protein [Candidatus Neptunochlamydia vexilliferae]